MNQISNVSMIPFEYTLRRGNCLLVSEFSRFFLSSWWIPFHHESQHWFQVESTQKVEQIFPSVQRWEQSHKSFTMTSYSGWFLKWKNEETSIWFEIRNLWNEISSISEYSLLFRSSWTMRSMSNYHQVDPRGMYYGITVVVSFHPVRSKINEYCAHFRFSCSSQKWIKLSTSNVSSKKRVED